jgi:hypothetical protein
MAIAALITEGIGPGGSVLYIMTGGLSIAEVDAPTVSTTSYNPGFIDGGRDMRPTRGGRSFRPSRR